MAMLGLSCRREVEASLDSPSNELSLPCKQEVQNALSGFSHVRWRRPPIPSIRTFTLARDLDAGEVPRIPEETGIVKHQRAIGASFVAMALVAVLARFVQRRRKGGGGSSKKRVAAALEEEARRDLCSCACVRADSELHARA